jgi:hypothetical protein
VRPFAEAVRRRSDGGPTAVRRRSDGGPTAVRRFPRLIPTPRCRLDDGDEEEDDDDEGDAEA